MLATEKNAGHFWGKRAVRVLPLYYAMTLFTYALLLIAPSMFANTQAKPVYLLKSLLFIPFLQDGAAQPLLRVGWTVNYEVLFYLLFGLSMRISMKFRGLLCSGMLVLLAAAGAVFPKLPEPFAFWTDSIVLEFAAGIGIFYAVRALWGAGYARHGAGGMASKDGMASEDGMESATGSKGAGRAAVYVALIAVSAGIFAYEWWSYTSPQICALPQVIRWGLPSAFLLFVFVMAGGAVKMPRVLVKIGDMSFSLYLLHYFPMRLLGGLIDNTTHPGPAGLLLALAFLAATLAGAWLCYLLIEKRLTDFLKRRLGI